MSNDNERHDDGTEHEPSDESRSGGSRLRELGRRPFLQGSAAALGAGALSSSASASASSADSGRAGAVRTETGDGVVASVHPQATAAGRDVLAAGGNAVDAAVATQFALNVVQPHTSGIGGGGFMLVYVAEEDELYAIDNRERAPLGAEPEMFLNDAGEPVPFRERHTNGKAVGVPGTLRACDVALKRFGTRCLGDLIEPAIDLAAPGCTPVEVDAFLAEAIRQNVDDGTLDEETLSVFAPGGSPLTEGDRLDQPDLADTFRLIRDEGIGAFYKGEIAEDIAETVQEAARFREEGGSMTVNDLARYNVDIAVPEYEPFEGAEETITARTMSLPSSGGLTIGQILALLESLDLADYGPNDAKTYHRLLEVFRLAYADRAALMGDTEFVDVPWQGLLDPDYLDERRATIPLDSASTGTPEAGDAWSYQPGNPYRITADWWSGSGGGAGQRGQTTHFTVADEEGNLVSWTSTIEQLFGSGIMVPDRGFMLNNELTDFDAVPGGPNEVQPWKRPMSSTSPTIVFRDGEPFFTVGSPGGRTIITTVARVILNVAEFGMSIEEAIAAPRIYRDEDPEVLYEPFVPGDVRRELDRRGHELAPEPMSLGSVQAIVARDDGSYLGAGDFRRNSAVEGVDSSE